MKRISEGRRSKVKLLAIVCPPLAVLFCGKPVRAILAIPLCGLAWIPGVIYAWSVVNATAADKRTKRITKAIKRQGHRLR